MEISGYGTEYEDQIMEIIEYRKLIRALWRDRRRMVEALHRARKMDVLDGCELIDPGYTLSNPKMYTIKKVVRK